MARGVLRRIDVKPPMRASQCRPHDIQSFERFFRSAQNFTQVVILGVPPTKKGSTHVRNKTDEAREELDCLRRWQLGIRAAGVDPYPHLLLGDCRPRQLCCSGLGLCNHGGVAFARVAHAVFGQYRRLEGQQETLARGLHWHGRRAARMHGHSWQRDGVLIDVRGGDHHA